MSIPTSNVHTERGNAVALTLLGLSVAILAGVVVLYFIGRSAPEQTFVQAPVAEEDENAEEEVLVTNPRAGWRTYTSEEYSFSFEYPEGWIVATGTLQTGDPAISVAPAVSSGETGVFSLLDSAMHVSVYPLGVAIGGIIDGTKTNENLTLTTQATISDYALITGSVWATKVMFEEMPPSWNSAGFVFARVPIQQEEIIYMRDGEVISEHEFDTFLGDSIGRKGFVDSVARNIEEEILQSFSFEGSEEVHTSTSKEGRFIIDSPERGEIIKSPLSVQGQVFGKWFFEGDFSVRLETVDGEVLAEVPVIPQGVTDEETYAPFEVSLVFQDTTATSGVLFLGRSDSFDLPAEASVTTSIYVVFDNV